jgi:hypothetical protein
VAPLSGRAPQAIHRIRRVLEKEKVMRALIYFLQ